MKLEAERAGRLRTKQNPDAFASVFGVEGKIFSHQLELLQNVFNASREHKIAR